MFQVEGGELAAESYTQGSEAVVKQLETNPAALSHALQALEGFEVEKLAAPCHHDERGGKDGLKLPTSKFHFLDFKKTSLVGSADGILRLEVSHDFFELSPLWMPHQHWRNV